MLKALFTASVMALAAPTVAGVTVTFENPGVYNSTAAFDWVGVETFNDRPTGENRSFSTDFNTALQPFQVSGQYSGVDIRNAGQFGGAENTRYAETFTAAGYTVSLSVNDPRGINYFGYWLSALDNGNQLEFMKDGQVVFTFSPAAVRNAIGPCPDAANPYCGNPNDDPRTRVLHEQFAFVNIFFADGLTYDAIRFFEKPTVGGYESDNHTVGWFTQQSGNVVPEPATWAMLITGFGLVGHAARRRRPVVAA